MKGEVPVHRGGEDNVLISTTVVPCPHGYRVAFSGRDWAIRSRQVIGVACKRHWSEIHGGVVVSCHWRWPLAHSDLPDLTDRMRGNNMFATSSASVWPEGRDHFLRSRTCLPVGAGGIWIDHCSLPCSCTCDQDTALKRQLVSFADLSVEPTYLNDIR